MTEQRMSSQEAVALCRMAKAACPQQQFDQYTPDMWHELLGDLRFQDAKDALVEVVKSQPFVSPAEIRERVKKIRSDRVHAFGPLTPPSELADDLEAEHAWMAAARQRIADGEPVEDVEYVATRMLSELRPTLHAPPAPVRPKPRERTAEHADRLAAARAELPAPAPIPDQAPTEGDT